MKTSTKIFSGITVLALALASIGSVSADSIDIAAMGSGFGRGNDQEQDGLLADYMEAAIADSLGLSVEELNALEAEGETHYTIALDLGFSVEEFEAIMDSAQDLAIEMAAADGITIQQYGMAAGNGRAAGGADGAGFGRGIAETCDEETCVAEPLGTGMGRGGRR
jgi:hypothetical protein